MAATSSTVAKCFNRGPRMLKELFQNLFTSSIDLFCRFAIAP
jgi:hypothetical protein